jgi:cytochrome c peroxidase
MMRILLAVMLAVASCTPVLAADGVRTEPILPLPRSVALDQEKVALGERLFHDKRLSADNSISCAHCHELATGGTDQLPRSKGVGGALGIIKAPTVYNSGFNIAQFWDGRAPSLEQQVEGPLENPLEMGSSWEQVVGRLRSDPDMVRAFQDVFDGPVSAERIKEAIAEFQRSLITADSPFDRWLRGDEDAISLEQREGYLLFKSYGCVSCHQGVNVGGNMFGYMGAIGDYFRDRGGPVTTADLGRYNVTWLEEDRHSFKVPSLRLAAINPPYFHDGSAKTLDDAIRAMGRYQLGREIADEHVQAIGVFLQSLVGEHPRLQR